ncbi:hypothetical protein INR49_024075 [Caranx melampygus]|nr:hypothetical protein INR49_024075 [Caranx melampygus]
MLPKSCSPSRSWPPSSTGPVCVERMGRSGGIYNIVPAQCLVLFVDGHMVKQDADVRTDQLQQVKLLREGEVGGASFTHHAGQKHGAGRHLIA